MTTVKSPLAYLTVLVIATCGLVYELVAGTLASYLLGDSVTQFSTVIGVYLSALGLGSYLSRHVQRGLARRFVEVELCVALLGGAQAPVLFLAFGYAPDVFRPVLYTMVLGVGVMVGLEIPLIIRILRETAELRELLASVLTFDYIGALLASLLFPLLLLPKLGLVRTSLLFGIANAGVGLWSTWLFAPLLGRTRDLRVKAVLAILLLTAGFAAGDHLTNLAEDGIYADPVIFARQSAYQRIVMTRTGRHFQLFLNGNLQFSSSDEYRYHEALVHPAMALVPQASRVLILGGGDGLGAREVLRYPNVKEIVLVDLDGEVTHLASTNALLREQNHDSLRDPRVHVVNDDAFVWLGQGTDLFDAAIVDFPDPHNFSVGKLYTTRFYSLLRRRLTPDAAIAVQTTSPLMARRSFWCVLHTIESAGFHARAYHALVPSFGEWGYTLAALRPFEPPHDVIPGLRFLDKDTLPTLFALGPDMSNVDTEINRLNNQVLVRYYDEDWKHWN
jgi:spermidine synthase